METYDQYAVVGALILFGLAAAALPLLLPMLISPHPSGLKTFETYECGVDTISHSWMRFSVGFYLFALIFVAFEVDILYLFPIALVFNDPAFGLRDVVEIGIFLGILSLAIVFAWRKGVFKWL